MSELKWPGAVVRQKFVDFFAQKYAHTFIPSSPVVPLGDPTLLFTNAGMNQFKDIFLGTVDPSSDFGKLKRAVNSQTCIRAGGKHNDLEDVGRDTYHHTFFEMLGTWSFADYFKKEAIEWAWELLTVVYALPKDRLYATYFEGAPSLGIPEDTQARDLWLQFLPPSHVLKGNAKDNFWEMGDVGPCGPCSELHFDRIGGRDAAHLVNKDDPMVIEIWNLVFMQFHRKEKGGALSRLPSPHVDTGMGLERLVSILQNVTSNYDTDLWSPLFIAIQDVTQYPKSYRQALEDEASYRDVVVAYRVIADHIRCVTMALSDGALPDNVGRGFVLRRIIRRAVRYGNQFLNAETGFFAALVPAVQATLGSFFTHISSEANLKRVQTILREEEESFARTWKTGLKHFEIAKQKAIAANSNEIDASEAFILHDRYGFPFDLTRLLAEKEGLVVSEEKFDAEMRQNQTSGGRMAANKTFFDAYQVDELQKQHVPPTADDFKYTWSNITATSLALFDKDAGAFCDAITHPNDHHIGVVLDRTNYYYESGGQIYDTGIIRFPDGLLRVERVHSFGGYVVHIGRLEGNQLRKGDAVQLEVDYARRAPIAANHTTTHQINHALRDVLQFRKKDSFMEVSQRGSYVADDLLRFDFSWNAKLTPEEVAAVEELTNDAITKNLVVYSLRVPLAEACNIKYIRRNFEDKYPDPVTVISIGRSVEDMLRNPSSDEWKAYSVELCGGTHLKTMGEAKEAVVISEESLMKGVRRMVVYTGAAAAKARELSEKLRNELETTIASVEFDFDEKQKALSVIAKVINDSDIPLLSKWRLRDAADAAVKSILAEKKAAALKARDAAAALGASWTPAGPLTVITVAEFGAEREPLQAAADAFLAKHGGGHGVFVIGLDSKKDKGLAVVSVHPDLVARGISAVDWVRACGKGGGKPGAAQLGMAASDADKVAEAARGWAATAQRH